MGLGQPLIIITDIYWALTVCRVHTSYLMCVIRLMLWFLKDLKWRKRMGADCLFLVSGSPFAMKTLEVEVEGRRDVLALDKGKAG